MNNPAAEFYRVPLKLLWQNRNRVGFVHVHIKIEGEDVAMTTAWRDGALDPDWQELISNCQTPELEADVIRLRAGLKHQECLLLATRTTPQGGLHYVGYIYTHAAIKKILERLDPSRPRRRLPPRGFGQKERSNVK